MKYVKLIAGFLGCVINPGTLLTLNPDGDLELCEIGNLFPDPVLFTAPSTGEGLTFSPVPFKARTVLKSKGELFKGSEWVQNGNEITILTNVNVGNTIYIKP